MLTREELARIIEPLMEIDGFEIETSEDYTRIVAWDVLPDGSPSYMATNSSDDPFFVENDLTLLQLLDKLKERGLLDV